MEKREIAGSNVDGGFSSPIYEGDLRDEEHRPTPSRQQVSLYVTPLRQCRPATLSLVLLAVVLLMVDIGLGVHYNNLKDTHLTPEDTQRIGHELTKLQDAYKTAIESMNSYKKQMDKEISGQTQTNWEFDYQTKRRTDYEASIAKMTDEISGMRHHLPMIKHGCTQCPPGWILMNSVCYFYSFSDAYGLRSWQKARDYCKMHGGDLAVINSKDKENSTVNHLSNNAKNVGTSGFWIGLSYSNEEGAWQWLDRTVLVEGYWMDGEPNNLDAQSCAGVYPRENFFKAWKNVRCGFDRMKWICEKAPNSQS